MPPCSSCRAITTPPWISSVATSDRGAKVAYIDDGGSCTYAELAERVDRAANALLAMELAREDRIGIAMLDSADWVALFLGAIKAGIVPVAMNTLLTPKDYEYQLRDSRSRALFVSEPLLKSFEGIKCPDLKRIVPHSELKELISNAGPKAQAAPTTRDDICFWLYSSGSTGAPKGTVHLHSHLIATAELYAKPILGIRESDVVFSAAKLFFAYGLGNALTFPMSVGATTVLMAERPTPDAVFKRLVEKQADDLLRRADALRRACSPVPAFPKKEQLKLRVCTSAGEALPENLGKRWTERFGVEILDGIGSTEMLHIFISNRPGEVRYGTTGKPVPGYEVRLVDDDGKVITKPGELGELQISGPTSAIMYWNQREKTKNTFQGPWTRSGRQVQLRRGRLLHLRRALRRHAEGERHLRLAGRGRGRAHHARRRARGRRGRHRGRAEAGQAQGVRGAQSRVSRPSEGLKSALQQHVKDKLAPYKYPRWIEFMSELPKTATGKIQRFKLRS